MLFFSSCDYSRRGEFESIYCEYVISSNSFKNFKELRAYINKISCYEWNSSSKHILIESPFLNIPLLAQNCDDLCVKSRNIFIIKSSEDLDEKKISIFIQNYGKTKEYSEAPTKALIVFDLNENTETKKVFELLNKISKIYFNIWKTKSKSIFNKEINNLNEDELHLLINKKVPFNVKIRRKKGTSV